MRRKQFVPAAFSFSFYPSWRWLSHATKHARCDRYFKPTGSSVQLLDNDLQSEVPRSNAITVSRTKAPRPARYLCLNFSHRTKSLSGFRYRWKCFGDVFSYVRVTKFQKKGVPHSQCILLLSADSKLMLMKSEFINSIISAETPYTQNQTSKYAALKHNLYQPCRVINPSSVLHKMVTSRNDFQNCSWKKPDMKRAGFVLRIRAFIH